MKLSAWLHLSEFASNNDDYNKRSKYLVIRPSWHCTQTVQPYSPGSTNIHPHQVRGSSDPQEYAPETTSRSVQPFLHSLRQRVPVLYNGLLFPLKLPLHIGGSGPHLLLGSWANPILHPKRYLDWLSSFWRAHNCNKPRYSVCNSRLHLCSAAMWPNNTNTSVYDAVIMARLLQKFTLFICWMQTECQVAANPQTKPTDLACW